MSRLGRFLLAVAIFAATVANILTAAAARAAERRLDRLAAEVDRLRWACERHERWEPR